ncbi:MAG: PAS domain S-box protein [Burkholderiales bacterium]|jgi:PAS domain S-box-containing protein
MAMKPDVLNDRAREALRVSESRYRRLFETARDGILLLNADTGQIEDVNPYLIQMLGYTHAEFLGKKLWEVGAFADIAESKEIFAVLQEKGYVRYDDLPLKTIFGKKVDVEFVSNSYNCEGVKVIQCNIRDISGRHDADRVLREFKAIVDASDDAIVSTSLDGVIKSWNPGAERLFGHTADEAIGSSMMLIVPPGLPDEGTEMIAPLSGGDKVEHVEAVRRHKDGRLIDISVTISPIRDKCGKTIATTRIARDITGYKQAANHRIALEEQLRESQKMEAIGTLAGGIAHDFNNIIAAILGNAELALEDTKISPSAQTSIAEIRKAASRGRDLVQQILAFSRRQPTERKRIKVDLVVFEAVRLLRATMPARLSLDVHCSSNVPPVMADATQIEQVLINLATNAMQAMPSGPGRISIRLDMVMLDAAPAAGQQALRAMHTRHAGPAVRIAVSDTGAGIGAAVRERIFEPFFTTKPVNQSTGLGLSVVHGIVQGHEGAITVASEPGMGTTFMIYLPVADDAAGASDDDTSAAAAPPALKPGTGQSVLYLDDDDSLVFLVKRLLERRGYRVSAYTDAKEALAALRADSTAFDLVVTDYNMPGMSGLDVAREVRTIRADLPVAVATGFVDEALRVQAGDAGVRELIFKADDVEIFCATLQRLLPPHSIPESP